MKNQYHCIGGPLDGQLIAAEGNSFRASLPPKPPTSCDPTAPAKNSTIDIVEYRLRYWLGRGFAWVCEVDGGAA